MIQICSDNALDIPHTYTYMYIHVHIYICIYIYIYIFIYFIYTCVYVHTQCVYNVYSYSETERVCVCACMYVYVHTRVSTFLPPSPSLCLSVCPSFRLFVFFLSPFLSLSLSLLRSSVLDWQSWESWRLTRSIRASAGTDQCILLENPPRAQTRGESWAPL